MVVHTLIWWLTANREQIDGMWDLRGQGMSESLGDPQGVRQ